MKTRIISLYYNVIIINVLVGLFFSEGCKNKEVSTVTDIDGNVYKTIKIGTQIWMIENLKVTHYSNGDSIPNIINDSAWSILSTAAYCNYNNNTISVKTYGRLYNWFAIRDTHHLAPKGWHIPTDKEWLILTNYLGNKKRVGGKLKEEGTLHWTKPNEGATNESGFLALPGGYRYYNGSYNNMGNNGSWWSSTEVDSVYVWSYYIGSNYTGIGRGYAGKTIGISVRCIKN